MTDEELIIETKEDLEIILKEHKGKEPYVHAVGICRDFVSIPSMSGFVEFYTPIDYHCFLEFKNGKGSLYVSESNSDDFASLKRMKLSSEKGENIMLSGYLKMMGDMPYLGSKFNAHFVEEN